MSKKGPPIDLPSVRIEMIEVSLPFGLGAVGFVPDKVQEEAAWQIYVELITRVSLQRLNEGDGLLREALNSLYRLFTDTRQILREAGPRVAHTKRRKDVSLGAVAILVLNKGLRPFMSKWHPRLEAWEKQRPPDVSAYDHEQTWEHNAEMRRELEEMRKNLVQYSDVLAEFAQVEPILKQLEDGTQK